MGAIITEAAVKADVQIRDTILLNLGNGIVPHGDSNELRRKYRLDAVSIADEALKHIKNKNE